MSWIWNLIQQRQIRNLEDRSADTLLGNKENRRSKADLEERIDQLSLISEAMWELLRDSSNISETMLLNKVEEIDIRDGKLDGKKDKSKLCNSCGRKINPRRKQCVFCGETEIIESAWEKV